LLQGRYAGKRRQANGWRKKGKVGKKGAAKVGGETPKSKNKGNGKNRWLDRPKVGNHKAWTSGRGGGG